MGRLVIGLVGQVCAGKSAVAEAFRKRGALVYDADAAVHGLYERSDVKAEVRAIFGPDVFDAAGVVDRKALGARVFGAGGEALLKRLTAEVLFPRTAAALEARREEFFAGTAPALILDAPTLFEAGRADRCDRIVFVSAPRERREQWARERRGWDAAELARRDSRMMPEAEKRRRCHAEIVNAGGLQGLDEQAGRLWSDWQAG